MALVQPNEGRSACIVALWRQVTTTVGSSFVQRFWALIDIAIVLVFVAIGRSVHEHGDRLGGLASTGWPFGVGLLLGWIFVALRRRSGVTVPDGIVVALITVFVAMVLRVLAGQGTAVAFIIVALVFLGGAMLGWRAVLVGARRHRAQRAQR